MIGDSNGYTEEKVSVSINNPYLERYFKILDLIEATEGTWGLILDEETIVKTYIENQITADDCQFIVNIMKNEDDDFCLELSYGIKSNTEYSFLIFQGLDLFYIDEYGITHKTEVV